MKILLTAVNAKYIHSNLAVYSLRAYARKYLDEHAPGEDGEKPAIDIAEYTINQRCDDILRDIYKRKPDVLCFSCYIWNIAHVREITREIGKVLGKTAVWLGGPEVSYDAVNMLRSIPEAAGVIKGEGEETFARLAAGEDKNEMEGITFRRESGEIVDNPWRPAMDLNDIPFVYCREPGGFENKIIYYESSRGCPFSCSYCLSSIDKQLRFRDVETVKQELQFFIDHEVPQVKFVDRTFNCNHRHALEIWRYVVEHDRGITNFHFEISADLLNEEEMELLQSMRPGLVQLEIGVQTTNPRTIREIRRTMQFSAVSEKVRRIRKNGNIHQHLDLIAGLPYEDLRRFAVSFDEVYALKPQQLQLGFLKVLKGSYMETRSREYGLLYKSAPPYEVLSTRWMSYDDILYLKGIEEMVETYYNSAQFVRTMSELEKCFTSPFEMYGKLSRYYFERRSTDPGSHSRADRYEILLGFAAEAEPDRREQYRELLTYDYYLRENAKSRPKFAGEYRMDREELRSFYCREAEEHRYLKGYEGRGANQLRKMTHLEYFSVFDRYILFDYSNRDPLTKEAETFEIERRELLIAKTPQRV